MNKLFGAVFLAALLLSGAAGAREHRSHAQTDQFRRTHMCPSTHAYRAPCPGYVIDHINPLCKGGPDLAENMQFQTIAAGKAKDRWECK